MNQINCLRCKQAFDASYDQCPHCGEKVTLFQRTYSTRLLDGKYQIIDRLGVGGMGEIFKVRHIHLNELRVIKIMRPNVAADDQGLQRFLQEARTSTMIKHRNLAMLYDFAQLEDGSYYMVWEFIDGTNIQKWMAQTGAIPPRLAVEISAQALTGLEHLHQMGLIHRDISPENIMLSQDHHGKLLVKVIDFGIAKQLAEGEGGQGLTQTGMFLGKLKYASPEQAGFLKEGEHLDPRSDLYSFGILMYEMLAGRAPFQATNPHGYILKHVTEKPLPIAELSPGITVPPQLEVIIMRALEKNREARFATAGDFAEALEAIRNSIPPDQKYGLGEKMITLSGAQTLADLPKITGTGPSASIAGTQVTQHAGPPGTQAGSRPGSNDATMIERNFTAPTPSIGSNEPTVLERIDASGAAPTELEAKMTYGGVATQPEATVLERKMGAGAPAPPANRTAMIVGVAAVLAIVLGIGGFFLLRDTEPAPVGTTAVPAATAVTTTAPAGGVIPGGQGALLLSASPWGDIESIVRKSDQKQIDVEDGLSTPARILLAPGDYSVTLRDQNVTRTIDVQIQAGQQVKRNVSMDDLDFDAITRDVTRP